MKSLRSNRGATLLELVAAVAVLSIVGLSAFALLMFSIRTNNYIVDGSAATQDANLLNSRLELFFDDKITVESTEEGQYSVFLITSEDEEAKMVSLTFEGDTLKCDDEIVCNGLSAFKIDKVNGTRLIRVSYTIEERSFVKLFRLCDPPAVSEQ